MLIDAGVLFGRVVVHPDIGLHSDTLHDPFLPFNVIAREFRLVQIPAVKEGKRSADPHNTAPRPFSDDRAKFVLLEPIRHNISVGRREFIEQHDLWPENRSTRINIGGAVACDVDHRDLASQSLDDLRRYVASPVPAHIHDQTFFPQLRIVILHKLVQSPYSHIRDVKISYSAVRCLRYLLDIGLNPIVIVQPLFIVCRNHHNIAGTGLLCSSVHLERHLLVGGIDERLIDTRHPVGRFPVNGDDVLSCLDGNADIR